MGTPTLRQLRTFMAVVEAGSVSAGARLLNFTQPAASQQLRELERALSVRLLERAGGKAIPTVAGQALLDPARRAQAAAGDAIAATARHRRGDIGRVRLGTGATACIFLMPPGLAAVKRAMPGLAVTVVIGNTADMLIRLEAGDLDVALVTMPVPANRALSTTRLLSDPLLALLPDALLPAGAAVTAAQLGAMPLILYEPGGNSRAITNAWFRHAGITPLPPTRSLLHRASPCRAFLREHTFAGRQAVKVRAKPCQRLTCGRGHNFPTCLHAVGPVARWPPSPKSKWSPTDGPRPAIAPVSVRLTLDVIPHSRSFACAADALRVRNTSENRCRRTSITDRRNSIRKQSLHQLFKFKTL